MDYIQKISNNLTEKPSKDKIWLSKCKRAAIKLPDSKLNVYDYLYECNKNHLNDVALIYDALYEYESTKITFYQLFKKIDDCAKAFKALGVKEGDIVTISLPSFVENIVIFYALNKIGAIPNEIHPLASKDEVGFYLSEVNSNFFVSYSGNMENFKDVVEELDISKVIMVSPKDEIRGNVKLKILKDNINKLRKDNSNIKEIYKMIKSSTSKETFPNKRYISYSDFIKLGKSYKGLVRGTALIDGINTSSITHTSGTTGQSKGVVSSSFGFNEMTRQIAEETPILERGDKELLVLPPYPVYVLCNNVHMCLSRGITVIVVPKVDYQNIHKYFEKYDITAIQAIPSIIKAMINDKGFEEKNINLEQAKFIVSGGGSLAPEELERANKFLHKHNCKYNITVGYGMSEMGSCATCTFDEKNEESTIGRPLNDTNIMIVDPDTKEELSYNTPGEIWLSGPSRMICYYNNKEKTNEIFEKVVDENGKETVWVKTGDLGLIDYSGNLKYVGRMKRITMIVDSNTNTVSKISNDFVEDLIIGKYISGNVSNCVVISVPSEKRLNELKAYVVVKEGPIEEIANEINSRCEQKLREMAMPVEYVFVEDDIPLTKAGKKDYIAIEEYEKNPSCNANIKVRARIRKK